MLRPRILNSVRRLALRFQSNTTEFLAWKQNLDDLVSRLAKTNTRPAVDDHDRLVVLRQRLDGKPESPVQYNLDRDEFEALRARLSEPDVDLRGLVTDELEALYYREEVIEPDNDIPPPPEVKDDGIMGLSRPYTPTELSHRRDYINRTSGTLGGKVATPGAYKPYKELYDPPTAGQLTLNMLVAAGAHIGSSVQRLRQSMIPFIVGHRDGVHVIDLDKTLVALRRATKVVRDVVERGGIVLVVGTRRGQMRTVEINAARMGGYHLFDRWVPGILTNAAQVIGERDTVMRDLTDKPVAGLKPAGQVRPDLVIMLNPVENRVALLECQQTLVPTIGVCDTDMEPTLLTYPIPANDDSLRTIDLIAGILGKAGEQGRIRRIKYHTSKRELELAKQAEEEIATKAELADEAESAGAVNEAKVEET
ncbi:hypothetical protein V1512DRAFT_262153, partial [Lipomyces arxii]|uniref:mitochondrial 37S ribosomal protein uS2m n=1 Tax=Lipomyces arxii TaxID=56418 RepID=UPI0034CE0565